MKYIKNTLIWLLAFTAIGWAKDELDVGVKLGERPGYGMGEHYFNDRKFTPDKRPKLLSKLIKGEITYKLIVTAENIFTLQSTPRGLTSQPFLRFKLTHVAERYLIDVAQIDPDHVMVAITDPPYGYTIIKFEKRKNGVYFPLLFADINFVPGTRESDANKVKELGFDGQVFVVKLRNEHVDRFAIPDDQNFMLRNGELFQTSRIQRFDGNLPVYLRIE